MAPSKHRRTREVLPTDSVHARRRAALTTSWLMPMMFARLLNHNDFTLDAHNAHPVGSNGLAVDAHDARPDGCFVRPAAKPHWPGS